jgi:phosphotransferase system HPr (HPr) family protein
MGLKGDMKCVTVTVRWAKDRPLQQAARLVKMATRFHSTILLKCNGEIADLRRNSIVSIVTLCAMTHVIELEVAGDDELTAMQTISRLFAT